MHEVDKSEKSGMSNLRKLATKEELSSYLNEQTYIVTVSSYTCLLSLKKIMDYVNAFSIYFRLSVFRPILRCIPRAYVIPRHSNANHD